jgi:hypothetical protein
LTRGHLRERQHLAGIEALAARPVQAPQQVEQCRKPGEKRTTAFVAFRFIPPPVGGRAGRAG